MTVLELHKLSKAFGAQKVTKYIRRKKMKKNTEMKRT